MGRGLPDMFNELSAKSRTQKLRIFFQMLGLTERDRVLDVGGECDPTCESIQLCESYPWKHRLTILNYDGRVLKLLNQQHPEISTVLGDARSLPFLAKSFDVIYSNAVIEHLGTWENQRAMACEIQRVARRWFVSTPNRWFPYEFHARVPLVSWLPPKFMTAVCRHLCYNHVERRYRSGIDLSGLRLLSARNLRQLFPGSQILPLRITFYPESLIVCGKK